MYSETFQTQFGRLLTSESQTDWLYALQILLEANDIWAFNYGYFDTREHDFSEAPVNFISTMDESWINHYSEKRYDLIDHGVANIRSGNLNPIFAGKELICAELNVDENRYYNEAAEVGFLSSSIVPLRSPNSAIVPEAGIGLISRLNPFQFKKMWEQSGAEIMVFLMQLHHLMSPHLGRKLHDINQLTPKEKDCLALIAAGFRPDRISDKLKVATVTVNMHIQSARKRLGAKTNAEAISIALRTGQL